MCVCAQPAAASLQTFQGMKSASVYKLGARKEASLAARVAARAVSYADFVCMFCGVCGMESVVEFVDVDQMVMLYYAKCWIWM